MGKLIYKPKIYSTITTDTTTVYNPKVNGIIENNVSDTLKPLILGYFANNFSVKINHNNVFSIVEQKNNSHLNFKTFAIIDTPNLQQSHNIFDIKINVAKKLYSNNTLRTVINVERVGTSSDDTKSVIGYNTTVKPFFTYDFTDREYIQLKSFVTYTISNGINITENPFITYIDYDFDDVKKQRKYSLVIFNNFMVKTIKCLMYDNTIGFPIKDVHLTFLCPDGKRRYVPLNHVNSDFDSGVRCQDEFGNNFQICVGRQDNIINKYFPYGNILIPLNSYDYLYKTLVGVFGTARVKMGENKDCVYFSPPSAASGITKMFIMGLNVRITTKDDVTLTTYKNGINDTSYGGDKHWTSNCMLIKFHSGEKFKIQFDDSYYGTSYAMNVPVKNSIVMGNTVEAMKEYSDNYINLISSTKWFLYNNVTNYINVADSTNQYVTWYKKKYLLYTNSKHTYNYFDLQQIQYRFDEFGNLL